MPETAIKLYDRRVAWKSALARYLVDTFKQIGGLNVEGESLSNETISNSRLITKHTPGYTDDDSGKYEIFVVAETNVGNIQLEVQIADLDEFMIMLLEKYL